MAGWAAAPATSAPSIAALVAEFSTLLYRVAFSIVRNPAEAEDIVQETFVRVLENENQLAAVRELRPWLIRITWNLALDRRRRIRPDQMDDATTLTLVAPDVPADERIAQARSFTEVLAQIDRLPTKEREALLLSAFDELSHAEIAAITNRSESSVRSLIFRARAHLQQRLEHAAQRPKKGDSR